MCRNVLSPGPVPVTLADVVVDVNGVLNVDVVEVDKVRHAC